MRSAGRESRVTAAWRCAALAALLCSAVLLGGCIRISTGSTEPASPRAKQGAKATSSAPKHIDPAMVGTELKSGPWQVTVNTAERARKRPDGAKAPSGKEFLLVDVDFKNGAPEALVVRPTDFSLKTAKGKTLPVVSAPAAYNARSMRPILFGYGTSTVFVYAIPKGSGGYVFTFAPKVAGKQKALRWSVP